MAGNIGVLIAQFGPFAVLSLRELHCQSIIKLGKKLSGLLGMKLFAFSYRI